MISTTKCKYKPDISQFSFENGLWKTYYNKRMFNKCLLLWLRSRELLYISNGLFLSVVHFKHSSWHFLDSLLLQGWRTLVVPLTFHVLLWCGVLTGLSFEVQVWRLFSGVEKCLGGVWGSVICCRQNALPSSPAFLSAVSSWSQHPWMTDGNPACTSFWQMCLDIKGSRGQSLL